VPGIHLAVLQLALDAGLPVRTGTAVSWLSGRGHLNPDVARANPGVIDALASIHGALGGDTAALATKRPGNPPVPDLVHTDLGLVIEVDEVQHFTTARLATFDYYPPDLALGFDIDEYRLLITRWRAKGDAAFAHRVSADFPQPGGRQAQRAYNDALRDLLAPTFTHHPAMRIAAPDRSPTAAFDQLRVALRRLDV
jgi:hypothetical protein